MTNASASPLKTLWLHPRSALRRILERPRILGINLIAALVGINLALDTASNRSLGDEYSFLFLLLRSLFVGTLAGVALIWLFAALLKWTGKALGGAGNVRHAAAAVAWSSVPGLVGLVFWMPQLLFFGGELFRSEMPTLEAKPYLLPVLIGCDLIAVAFSFWGLGLLCAMVTEAQSYGSVWRGIANLAIAIAVVLLATFLLGLLGLSLPL